MATKPKTLPKNYKLTQRDKTLRALNKEVEKPPVPMPKNVLFTGYEQWFTKELCELQDRLALHTAVRDWTTNKKTRPQNNWRCYSYMTGSVNKATIPVQGGCYGAISGAGGGDLWGVVTFPFTHEHLKEWHINEFMYDPTSPFADIWSAIFEDFFCRFPDQKHITDFILQFGLPVGPSAMEKFSSYEIVAFMFFWRSIQEKMLHEYAYREILRMLGDDAKHPRAKWFARAWGTVMTTTNGSKTGYISHAVADSLFHTGYLASITLFPAGVKRNPYKTESMKKSKYWDTGGQRIWCMFDNTLKEDKERQGRLSKLVNEGRKLQTNFGQADTGQKNSYGEPIMKYQQATYKDVEKQLLVTWEATKAA